MKSRCYLSVSGIGDTYSGHLPAVEVTVAVGVDGNMTVRTIEASAPSILVVLTALNCCPITDSIDACDCNAAIWDDTVVFWQ